MRTSRRELELIVQNWLDKGEYGMLMLYHRTGGLFADKEQTIKAVDLDEVTRKACEHVMSKLDATKAELVMTDGVFDRVKVTRLP